MLDHIEYLIPISIIPLYKKFWVHLLSNSYTKELYAQ